MPVKLSYCCYIDIYAGLDFLGFFVDYNVDKLFLVDFNTSLGFLTYFTRVFFFLVPSASSN